MADNGLTKLESGLMAMVVVLMVVGGLIAYFTLYGAVKHGAMCACNKCVARGESFNGSGPWKLVGSATLADISQLGQVKLPLEEAVLTDQRRGMRTLIYRYRLVLGEGQYLYLTGTDKAYDGMGKYLLGNQPVPPGYGGLYILHLNKEGIPSGFRLPGFRNLGKAAEVMVSGNVGPYKYTLQGRKQYLNSDKYEYRVVIPTTPSPTYVHLLDDHKLRNGDTVRPVPISRPYESPGPFAINNGYGPGVSRSQTSVVAYKVMLQDY